MCVYRLHSFYLFYRRKYLNHYCLFELQFFFLSFFLDKGHDPMEIRTRFKLRFQTWSGTARSKRNWNRGCSEHARCTFHVYEHDEVTSRCLRLVRLVNSRISQWITVSHASTTASTPSNGTRETSNLYSHEDPHPTQRWCARVFPVSRVNAQPRARSSSTIRHVLYLSSQCSLLVHQTRKL